MLQQRQASYEAIHHDTMKQNLTTETISANVIASHIHNKTKPCKVWSSHVPAHSKIGRRDGLKNLSIRFWWPAVEPRTTVDHSESVEYCIVHGGQLTGGTWLRSRRRWSIYGPKWTLESVAERPFWEFFLGEFSRLFICATRCILAISGTSRITSSSCFCRHLKTELFAGRMAFIHRSTFVIA